jgi:hypothetical protein
MASPREALDMLRANPMTFLSNYYVRTYQGHGSGQIDYSFAATGVMRNGREVYDRTQRPGRILGQCRMHNSKNFKFAPTGNAAGTANFLGARESLPVWHVDVVMSDTIAIGAIPFLQVAGGPDIMVTTLLSGCSFVCEAMGASVLMAHVMPRGQTSTALADAIGAGGHFNGSVTDVSYYGGNEATRGAGLGYNAQANDVTVVGVRLRNFWHIYAQKHTRRGRDILSVTEFFHG